MKRVFLLLFCLLLFEDLFSQFNNVNFDHYEQVGQNLITKRGIMAYKYDFDDEIYRTYFDTINNLALVYIPKRIYSAFRKYDVSVSCFDLDAHKVKWTIAINPNRENVFKTGRSIVLREGKKVYLLDSETGEKQLMLGKNIKIPLISSTEGWCMCYTWKYNQYRIKAKKFRCLDLNTAEVLWTRDLDLTYETKVVAKLNDSVNLFVGNGIHSVNKHNGEGWDYEMKTNRYYYHSLGFSYYVDIADVRSRLLVDSTYIYMAGAEQIVKLDHDGNLIWSTNLPSDKTSSSMLACDDMVMLVNQGYAQTYAGWKAYGRPFIAAFDKETGEMLYLQERKMYADYFFDAHNTDDALFVLSADEDEHQSIEKYQLASGSLLSKVDFAPANVESSGVLKGFVHYSYYMKVDSTLMSLHDVDSLGVFVAGSDGVLHYDEKLDKSEWIPYNDLYAFVRRFGDLRCLRHNGQLVIVDENGHEVANLNLNDLYFTESEIYSVKDKYLYVINPEQLSYEREIELDTIDSSSDTE